VLAYFLYMKILVTGCAGFIGHALSERLLHDGHGVVGVDAMTDYYDVSLKQARLNRILDHPNFRFFQTDLGQMPRVKELFEGDQYDRVIHLAAQAGVRYSIDNPHIYLHANLAAFLNVLEACREKKLAHLIYASTSSVYGLNQDLPFREQHPVDHPVSLYAATKRANELMAHSYSYLYRLPTTGLRFFTVYGPWGRPDMAFFKFTRNIIEGKPIDVFNEGKHNRDFTYIDDVVEGLVRVALQSPPNDLVLQGSHCAKPNESAAPFRIYNIGNNSRTSLMRYIEVLEACIGRVAVKNFLPMQLGDVESTEASIDELERDFGYKPSTTIEQGLDRFVSWYREYYGSGDFCQGG